ncbi:beta-propeller fold lactonase family protein [Candidatus Poribacteria bacterium]|nr:beta-propeller fold lactonase family protein [Candidatus Poribacteria bacterium]
MRLPFTSTFALVMMILLVSSHTAQATSIYVTNEGSNTVSVIDGQSDSVIATIPVGSQPRWMSLSDDLQTLYVTNHGSNDVSVISTAGNAVIGSVPVDVGPCWVEVAGQFLGVSNRDAGSLSLINRTNNSLVSTVQFAPNAKTNWSKPISTNVLAQQLGRQSIIALNEGTDEAVIIGVPLDGSLPFVEATIPTGTGSGPRWTDVLLNPTGSLSYVSDGGNNTVSVIRSVMIPTPSFQIIDTIAVGQSPFWLRLTPNAQFAYVVNLGSDSLSKISLANNQVVATIPVSQSPHYLAITDDSSLVFVPNFDDNTVSVVSVALDSVITTIPVGLNPNWVDFNLDGTKAYVANNGSNSISVIDIQSLSLLDTINVGMSPNQVIGRPHPHTIVPEPSTLLLFAVGIIGITLYGWRRQKKAA